MSTFKNVLRAAALTAALGTGAVALPANAAPMHGGMSAGGFHGGGGFHSGGGFHGGVGFHGGGFHGGGFHGNGMHTAWHGGWHNGRHGHFRGNVFIVDPGWYGYDYPYADYGAYNPYCDPNSAYYDPDYCYGD